MDSTLAVSHVTEQSVFDGLCQRWKAEPAIALDTEFMRTSTFYAKMGLLQIADTESIYLVDPLEIQNWDAFNSLLQESNCFIVIHSASEDLNLLLTHCGSIPRLIFDTQIAAAFSGLGFSLSYQALVMELLQVEIEKDETRSDWLRRPLTDKQLHYAANDVVHLLEIARLLRAQLEESGSFSWFEDECEAILKGASLVEQESYWDTLYANVSNAWRLNDQSLCYLRALCSWREVESRKRNKPRSWIVKDGDLQLIAAEASQMSEITSDALLQLPVNEKKFIQRYAQNLLTILDDCDQSDVSVDRSILNLPLDSSGRATLKQLQKVVTAKAQDLHIAPELLGRKRQLLDLLRTFQQTGQIEWAGNADSWRKNILEADFSRILNKAELSSE